MLAIEKNDFATSVYSSVVRSSDVILTTSRIYALMSMGGECSASESERGVLIVRNSFHKRKIPHYCFRLENLDSCITMMIVSTPNRTGPREDKHYVDIPIENFQIPKDQKRKEVLLEYLLENKDSLDAVISELCANGLFDEAVFNEKVQEISEKMNNKSYLSRSNELLDDIQKGTL